MIVNGTNAADKITASSPTPGTALISGLATKVQVSKSEFTQDVVTVNGLGGDDTVTGGVTVTGPAAIVANGGEGTDTAKYLGSDDDDQLFIVNARHRHRPRRHRDRHRRRRLRRHRGDPRPEPQRRRHRPGRQRHLQGVALHDRRRQRRRHAGRRRRRRPAARRLGQRPRRRQPRRRHRPHGLRQRHLPVGPGRRQ